MLQSTAFGTLGPCIMQGLHAQLSQLQQDNDNLRELAQKRSQVLTQSRRFIDEYLHRTDGGMPGPEQLQQMELLTSEALHGSDEHANEYEVLSDSSV